MESTKTQPRITGDFNWDAPEVLVSFVEGKDAEAVYEAIGNVPHNLTYDKEKNTIIGSSNIGAVRIDSILRQYGLRVANLRDLSRPEVMNKVRGKFYTDSTSLVLASEKDNYERNNGVIKQLTELVEGANGSVEFPLLITGFDYQEDKSNKDYGVKVVARDDFRALHDDRLQGKNSQKKFTHVDEIGIPIFDKNGNRTIYLKGNGLSRLGLHGVDDLDANWSSLGGSGADGRVVVVSDGFGAKNYVSQLTEAVKARKSELDKWLADSLNQMPK